MANYTAFTAEHAVDYIKKLTESELSSVFTPNAELSAYEFGDGNLNLVFRVTDQHNNSVILKQALPYARCVGESWPLSLDRARIEADVLINHGSLCPEHTVAILHHNAELALTVLEDLGHLQILRGAQINAEQFPKLASHVAQYLSRTGFYNSDFYLSADDKKAKVSQFINPDLCKITEDLFFTDPYIEHERNHFPAELNSSVQHIRNNNALKLAAAKLKARFLSCPQTLLHGDMHSGSIFVDNNTTKMIDPEFGFFGPVGFDIGSFMGNLLLNYCAQNGRITELAKRRQYQTHLLTCLQDCYSQFEEQWLNLASNETTDVSFANRAFTEDYLKSVLHDAIGYCGAELIRRTIGLAHVADIDGIENEQARLAVQQQTLVLGEQLMLNATSCDNKDEFFTLLISLLN
ncbi:MULTISPECIES: S-methyl-5-thioribose kinase [Pseudoalteromonas]|uniref:S-methyl-5-thioribose kinase n=1 Tax=Pseudoalteromonas TaxID=53246 RepID=UPI0015FB351C|nr:MULTISPECIES: S-methyl-5-thioribose kinase [Pseudoalteromonas]QMW14426.1 S-methyl-5-thioribose kinase [Pseudoalteromonas sp. MT33b]|tara:strand:- start:3990 stop:5207 length:1218 start_codon:yes stop_codon:yes gene_type:complete